jgi:hypothetical protein
MRYFNLKRSRFGWVPILAGLLAMPVGAQENLAPPPGWSKSVAGGDVTFVKREGGSRLVVKKLTPLSGSLRSWFTRQTERDGAARGQLTSPGTVSSKNGQYVVVRSFRTTNGSQSVIYSGYAVGDQGRFLIFSGSGPLSLVNAVKDLDQLGQQLGNQDMAASKRGGNAPTSARSAKTVTASSGPKLSPIKARGTLKSSQILGIYLSESYTTGVGDMMILEYNPVLLLRDGSARRDLEIPPLDVNLAQDKSSNAKDWGRWTRQGAKFSVKFAGETADEVKASYKTRPARPGETLLRGYTSMGGGGNTAMGGDVMTFYSNSYIFTRDGRFALKSSGGGSSSNVSALSSSKNGGRYRLDGHALTLKFNDGRQIRKLFYFYPNDNKSDVIGIGDSAYIGDK